MKQLFILAIICALLSCYKNKDDDYNSGNNNNGNNNCGTHDGKQLYKDGQGCYYYTDSYYSSKVYVEASECKCE